MAGILLVVAAIAIGLFFLITKKKSVFAHFTKAFYRFFAWVLLFVCLVMTLNCLILYHASTFSRQYFGDDDGLYTSAELFHLYNKVAGECNRLAELVERDETGMVIYVGTDGTEISTRYDSKWEEGLADMADEAAWGAIFTAGWMVSQAKSHAIFGFYVPAAYAGILFSLLHGGKL